MQTIVDAGCRGRYGSLHVRCGKSVKGGPPRQRTVLTGPEFDWVIDGMSLPYLDERFGRHLSRIAAKRDWGAYAAQRVVAHE